MKRAFMVRRTYLTKNPFVYDLLKLALNILLAL